MATVTFKAYLSWSNQPLKERHCNGGVELRRPLCRRKQLPKLHTKDSILIRNREYKVAVDSLVQNHALKHQYCFSNAAIISMVFQTWFCNKDCSPKFGTVTCAGAPGGRRDKSTLRTTARCSTAVLPCMIFFETSTNPSYPVNGVVFPDRYIKTISHML